MALSNKNEHDMDIRKFEHLNTCESIDKLMDHAKELRVKFDSLFFRNVIQHIRKLKVKLYFQDNFNAIRQAEKKKADSSHAVSTKPKKVSEPTAAISVSTTKPNPRAAIGNHKCPTKSHQKQKKKNGLSQLYMKMSDEERHRLNGDKNRKMGYSSTGVRLPTFQELSDLHAKKMERRKEYYRNKQSNPEAKRGSKNAYVNIPMGGQNKRY